jgi:hypothetical protein
MPPAIAQLSEAEIRTCYRVYWAAAELGILIRESSTQLGYQFSWEIPGDVPRRVHGSIQRRRDLALHNACKELLPHISDHL